MTPASPPEARLTDRAFVLPALTLILLTPPIVTIFDVPVFVFGIPLLHIYCFGLWLAAIIAGGLLSRHMAGRGRDRTDEAAPGNGA
ncbi:MAG: hypothetical protein KDJ86_03975 [Bauldia sp.]|uniref:hypothetical protein n=1 Tax=Bauldia sp. TaxID=2575872 RepID=UPI001DE34D59|nr:hypothetical protein [Bauldia sp.]MCB1490117.1 hypothetical protein [Bauldia sp.]MCB1494921.1 hypothetical protein [Bauldia sp.]